MKKVIKKTVEICDVCKKSESWYKCHKCGKAFCYDCRAGLVEYSHSVYCSGSGDGAYCKECDAALKIRPTAIFLAYRNIAALRREMGEFQAQFDKRRNAAEEALKQLIGK